MMGYRNPDSGLRAPVVVTVGFGRLFQLTGTRVQSQVLAKANLTAPPSRGTFRYKACFNIG